MRTVWIALFFFFMFSPLGESVEMKLTVDGRPNAIIVIPAESSSTLHFAAEELQMWIGKISGAKLTIQDSTPSQNGMVVFLGNKAAQTKYADDIEVLNGTDGFAIRTSGNALYIFGAKDKGTLNGVYAFMEKNTDIIWARAQDFGTIYTPIPTITATDVDALEIPQFNLRGWHICAIPRHTHRPTELWMARNGCNWVTGRMGNSQKLAKERKAMGFLDEWGTGHNLHAFISNEKYFKSNPEFFCLLDGKRRPISSRGSQLCFTCPTLPEVFAKEAISIIRKNPEFDFFNVLMEDNWNVCTCDRCTAPIRLEDGTVLRLEDDAFRSTQVFLFLNQVAEKVYKACPDKRINVFAYTFTAIPSKVKLFHTINIKYCPFVKNDKQPVCTPSNRKWEKRTREWAKASKNMIWREYYGCASGFPRPVSDIAAKDLRFIRTLGLRQVFSEYIPDNDKLYDNVKNNKWRWDVSAMEFWVITKLYWNPNRDVDELRSQFLTRAFHKAAPHVGEFYRLIREAWYSDATSSNYLDNEVKSANRYIVERGNEEKCRAALEKAAAAEKDPRIQKMISGILSRFENWMEEAEKNANPECTVPYVRNAVAASLDFSAPIWKNVGTVSSFAVMKSPETPSQYATSVRMIHDRKTLYVAFDCPHPAPDTMSAREPSDREEWTRGDHCELFFDGDQKQHGKYYQLAFDFKANRYDALGFDKKWDGDWSVKTEVTAKGWKALVRVPLETIGMKLTLCNKVGGLFYRYATDGKKVKGEHSSWKGNVVHHAAGFGDVILEME